MFRLPKVTGVRIRENNNLYIYVKFQCDGKQDGLPFILGYCPGLIGHHK